MIFQGTAFNGKLQYHTDTPAKIKQFLLSNEGKRIYVTFDIIKPSRTLNQNAYYHSVIIPIISDYTGDTPEDTHKILKNEFCPRFFDQNGNEYERSTTRMNTTEFKNYLERIAAEYGMQYGLYFPSPNEKPHHP